MNDCTSTINNVDILQLLKMPKWREIKEQDMFQTGDILLFHHNGIYDTWTDAFLSTFNNMVGWFTGSKYTHCAIVVKDPDFTSPPKKGLFVLESSYEPFPDAENGEYKIGAELVDFDRVMHFWPGQVYWRKLTCVRDVWFKKRLADAHSIIHNRPYDLLPQDWFKAEFEIKTGAVQRKKTFWCAALVAYLYTKWDFLPSNTPWSIVTAKSFGTEAGNQIYLSLKDCTLDSEIEIKAN